MRGDLGGLRAVVPLLGEVLLNLLAARTGRVEVRVGVARDLKLSKGATLNLVAERVEPGGKLGPVDGRRVPLGPVELSWLKGAGVARLRFGHVKDDDVGVELRRGVALHRTGAVVLEPSGDPLAGGLGRMIAADAGLNVALKIIERRRDAFLMRLADAVVAANESGERDALRGTERGVPSSTVRHLCDHPVGVRVGVASMARAYAGRRMLARDGRNAPRAPRRTSPIGGQLSVPLAANLVARRVVFARPLANSSAILPKVPGAGGFDMVSM
jgi:hypothetical protein